VDSPRAATGFAVLCVAVSGFCGLSYEVLWTRLLILVVDNSVYSFTAILVGFLLGMAVGSLLLSPLMKKLSKPLLALGLAQMAAAFCAYLLPFTIQVESVRGSVQYYSFLVQGVLFMVLLSATLTGMTLPLAVGVFRSTEGHVERRLGYLYAVSAVGGVAGALAGGFVLIPLLGLQKSLLLLNSLQWLSGGAILFFLLRGAPRAVACAWAGALLLLGLWTVPGDLIRGKYGPLVPEGRMIFYREGLAATAAVFDQPNGERVLYLNGIPEVSNDRTSVRTFRMMGALPCLVHKNPARALAITFGAGITSGTMVHFVERLDCVEMVGESRAIAEYFAAENGEVLKNKKVALYINDARHYLLTTAKTYAVIVADATHPRGYDSWVLFTREFYELVKKRLEPDGVFSQWVPLHGMNLEQYLSVVRTFHSVFPGASIWAIDRSHTILLGARKPGKIDFDRLAAGIAAPGARDDLRRSGLHNPFAFLSHFIMGEVEMKRMLQGSTGLITDDSPRHLFFPAGATFGDQYGRWPEENYLHLLQYEESVVPYLSPLGEKETEVRNTLGRLKMQRRRSF
jgi:spermidine synthase